MVRKGIVASRTTLFAPDRRRRAGAVGLCERSLSLWRCSKYIL